MKKKTYVFDKNTLEILDSLKQELGKKEVQILKEALSLYKEKVSEAKESIRYVEHISSKLDTIIKGIAELKSKVDDSNSRLHRIEGMIS